MLRSKVRDRFGGDRCPFNAHEILVHRALRPSAPRMRRLILCIHETLELHFRNASDPQVTAPRIPWTWLENPSGSYLDSAADTSMGSWCSADLVSSGSDMQHVESSKIFQVGITALIMGDLNSVAAVEEAHLRRLLAERLFGQ